MWSAFPSPFGALGCSRAAPDCTAAAAAAAAGGGGSRS